MLTIVLGTVGLLCLAALAAALAARSNRWALGLGTAGGLLACSVGAAASVVALLGERQEGLHSLFVTPLGPLHAALDPLSSFFLLCVFVVSGLATLYGIGYLGTHGRRRVASAVAGMNLLVASMVLVVVARDAVLFLLAWQLMSVVSFFLVTFESEREEVQRAGVIYLVASHVGIALILGLFLLLARASGSFDFEAWKAAGAPTPAMAGLGFVLALVGFGTKAGFWPFHVWLPEAHPAAPSHVSALMSGVMIKMGIYGLLRMLEFLGPPPAWWGGLLLGVGAVSGILGVLHALAQHDLKRLLAYHSVENIGIIALGLGVGLLARSLGHPEIAFLCLAGGLLHVLNHGLFKGLLFQGAGSVVHATGLRAIDRLGGLRRHMPHTALTFLVGSVAISGLPPLNGFASEWLIYLGAFRGAAAFPRAGAVGAIGVIVSLALIGGLAAACFVKAWGTIFLGQARGPEAEGAHESPRTMLGAMWTGAGLCVAVGLGAVAALRLVAPASARLAGLAAVPPDAAGPLAAVSNVAAVLVVVILALAVTRRGLLGRREVSVAPTWGCGYSTPTARMQYTATSFAGPTLAPFATLFRRTTEGKAVAGPFPTDAAHSEHLEDRAARAFAGAARHAFDWSKRLDFLQSGRVQLYLAYVLATLVALLVWQGVAGGPW